MKQNFFANLLLCCSTFLASCGGGGGSSSPPTTPLVTQADVLAVAKVGALYNEMLARFYTVHVLFAAGYLQGFSSSVGGTSSTLGTACSGGGTFDISVTRTGTYQGLHAGDTITTVYHQCNLGYGIADGSMSIAPAANYASLTAPYSVQFTLTENNLLLNLGGTIMRGNLSMPVAASVEANYDFNYSYSSATPVLFDAFTSGSTAPAFSVSHATPTGGTSLLAGVMKVNNNGKVSITTQGSVFSFLFTVAPVLSGPTPPADFFIPSSGAFRMSQGTGMPAGSSLTATVNGATVNITADTNGDSAVDMDFNTTYAALLGI